jgi:hypothetical protein
VRLGDSLQTFSRNHHNHHHHTTTTMSDNWFVKQFSKLMESSHISIPPPPTGVLIGPGPIDQFSTNFDNLFADDVKAAVDREEVSRAVLKQKLLNLKKHWKAKQVKFEDESASVRRSFLHYRTTCSC